MTTKEPVTLHGMNAAAVVVDGALVEWSASYAPPHRYKPGQAEVPQHWGLFETKRMRRARAFCMCTLWVLGEGELVVYE